MELILHGSQINLATRYKTPAPIVQYPTSQQRPASASRCLSSSNSLRDQQQQILFGRRPMSADNGHTKLSENYPRSALLNNSSAFNGGARLSRKTKNHASSTNILNLLLTEPIRRSWTSRSESDKFLTNKNNLSLGQRIKSKANPHMNVTDDEESSVEEDVQANSSGDDEYGPSNHRSEGAFSKVPLDSPATQSCKEESASLRSGKADHDKKYVTFSASTDFASDTPRLAGRTSTSPITSANHSKPDLPGRVSFSKNDIYELDYSDCENDNDRSHVKSDTIDDEARLKIIYQFHSGKYEGQKDLQTNTSIENKDIDSTQSQKSVPAFCCSMKCNSSGCSVTIAASADENGREISKTKPAVYDAKPFQCSDEPNAIIEDYKREIEQLNRQHQPARHIDRTHLTNEAMSFNPENMKYFDNNAENVQDKSSKSPPTLMVSMCEERTLPSEEQNDQASEEKTSSTWNHNDLSYGVPHDTKQMNMIQVLQKPLSSPASPTIRKDSSNLVIQNYLKATNQDKTARDVKLPSKSNLSKPHPSSKLTKETNKPRIGSGKPPSKSISSKNKVALKSATNLRENNRLTEFHMDKVESWMSIHEFDKSDSGASPENEHNESYNQAWRETPNSKTDDEGNYSFEDHLDGESTYDEIVSVIKEIDDQKHLDMAAMSDFDTEEFKIPMKDVPPTLRKPTIDSHASPDKMREILSYLDRVDSNCSKTIHDSYSGHIPDSFRSEIEFSVEPDIIGDMPKIADLIMLPNQQLARRVIALSLRANELSNAIQLSKEHMANVRSEKIKCIRAEKQNAQSRMAEQKKNFESIVLRHQGFIEQILKDKADLCDKVSALSRRIESQNQAWEHKLETEVVRVKEATMAGEKIRRERWVRENTKKIKELTVKGLELEINKMTCNHQKEIAELKRQHQQDLLGAVEDSRRQHETLEMGIRDVYAQDREVAIEKERNAIRERFERQIDAEQKSFEDQKSRLLADFAIERNRLHSDIKQKELDYERRKDELVGDKDDVIHHMKREFKERIALIDSKNQASLQSMRDQYESDFAIWKREHESALKLREVERENSIRNQCRIERDRQIDAIVAKVDAEVLKSQNDFDAKMTRLKDKYENEMSEIERNERCAREKYAEIRAKLAESEANRQNVESTAKQLQMQLQHTQKMYDNFMKDKENLKETARNEIQLEVAAVKKDRDIEIEKIYERVQQAIEKKDAAIELLHKDNAALKERCIKLEAVIRQQRKDYFIK